MKRFIIIALLYMVCMQTYAQKAIIYYEGGVIMYVIDHYAYEFQSLVEHYDGKNPLKPSAMIQVVYIKDKYCYYTLNLSSGWDLQNSLTIDGKSYVPDQELQDVVLEIVKYRVVYKRPISTEKIHAILKGERMKEEEAPYWPWL